jgi:hypothetical protein
MTYRDRPSAAAPLAPRQTWWRSLRCFALGAFTLEFMGHRWRIMRVNPDRVAARSHLHHMAGLDAYCERCGATWLDAKGPTDG